MTAADVWEEVAGLRALCSTQDSSTSASGSKCLTAGLGGSAQRPLCHQHSPSAPNKDSESHPQPLLTPKPVPALSPRLLGPHHSSSQLPRTGMSPHFLEEGIESCWEMPSRANHSKGEVEGPLLTTSRQPVLWCEGVADTPGKRTQAGNTSQRWAGRRREELMRRRQELQDERMGREAEAYTLCALTHGPTSDGGGLTWMLFSCRFR